MKKIMVCIFLFVLGFYLLGCDVNNNTKKPSIEMLYSDWYNCSKLPNMEQPFSEIYDGCYSIEIDENNSVIFKAINQEHLNGTLEYEVKEYTIDIEITFINNEIANGSLRINNDSPYLYFYYKGVYYSFTKYQGLSKEEFKVYRNEFNSFLRDAFLNNTYPSIEEIEYNELYREYTNFVQIDPCCNGPKRCVGVNKVSIVKDLEKGEVIALHNNGTIENIYDIENIVLVKLDGTFEQLEIIQDGQCFITNEVQDDQYFPINNPTLFYFECEKLK